MIFPQENWPIYQDSNLTTPVASEVIVAMEHYWADVCYNPSAAYPQAVGVSATVGDAQEALAVLLGGPAPALVWTSGGTESNHGPLLPGLAC